METRFGEHMRALLLVKYKGANCWVVDCVPICFRKYKVGITKRGGIFEKYVADLH